MRTNPLSEAAEKALLSLEAMAPDELAEVVRHEPIGDVGAAMLGLLEFVSTGDPPDGLQATPSPNAAATGGAMSDTIRDALGRDLVVIDIEASGLGPESYPIELAVGRTGHHGVESWLIQPDETWEHWDELAQDIHGIPREELEQSGQRAEEVCRCLEGVLGGGDLVYSYGAEWDQFWLTRLYAAAGRACGVRVVDVQSLPWVWSEALECPRAHRAADDVIQLIEALERALGQG